MLPKQLTGCSDSTRALKEGLDRQRLSPRVKLALRMYAYGACRTIKEAAELMDLDPSYLGLVTNSKPGIEFMKAADAIIQEKLLQGHQLMDAVGHRAVEVIASKMEHSANENIQLKAAIDLADRSPTYSKTQKLQMEAISLTGQDVQALAQALVEGKSVKEKFAHLASGDFDRIQDGNTRSTSASEDSERRD